MSSWLISDRQPAPVQEDMVVSNLLDEYPVVIEVPVSWGEMDAFQHVNNVVYFKYFESVRVACFDQLRMMELKEESGIGPILASTQCRFRVPLIYPDTVYVGTKIEGLEEDRFVMKYAVVSKCLQKVAAEGEGLVVFYNYKENRKAAIPPELNERILNMGKG